MPANCMPADRTSTLCRRSAEAKGENPKEVRSSKELQEFRRGHGACLACEAESAVSAKELRFGSEHYPIATPFHRRPSWLLPELLNLKRPRHRAWRSRGLIPKRRLLSGGESPLILCRWDTILHVGRPIPERLRGRPFDCHRRSE
jgi:hypothetical protein